MEALFLYLVPLLLFPISFAAIVLLQKRGPVNRPPGSSGWPIVGETINFVLEGTENFTKNRMKRHSPQVFRTSLMGEKFAFFCGEQGNKYLFTKNLANWSPPFLRQLIMFPEHIEDFSHISAQVRSLIMAVFKPEALKKCIPVMDSVARRNIDIHWAPNEHVQAFPLCKKFNFDLACKLFLGIEDPARLGILSDSFLALHHGMHCLPLNFPGTTFRRGVAGGARFRAELLTIIRDRRDELKQGGEADQRRDALSKMLLQNEDENGGQHFGETDLVYNITALFIGSYISTSTTMTFVLKHLAELPHIYDRVFQEVTAIAKRKGPDEVLTWEDVQSMKYSWNVVRETMRVAPPSSGMFKEVVTDITFAGFTIPKGWKTFWTVYSTHKDPMLFPDPEKIDPTRFEGSGPIPYTFVPFGGGTRMCPGTEYARVAVLAFVYNVVTRFKLEKMDPNEKITYDIGPTPTKGLPLRLIPHAL